MAEYEKCVDCGFLIIDDGFKKIGNNKEVKK